MIVQIYAVKDELAQRFKYPQYFQSKEEALRDFKTNMNETTLWRSNPGDFNLYRLGEYNDETGIYKSELELICGGRSVLDDYTKSVWPAQKI